jgi:histone H3/H4
MEDGLPAPCADPTLPQEEAPAPASEPPAEAPQAGAEEAEPPTQKRKVSSKKQQTPKHAKTGKPPKPAKPTAKPAKKVSKKAVTGLVRKRALLVAPKDALSTRSSVHRLALRHGCRRVSGKDVIDVARALLEKFVDDVLFPSVMMMENGRRKGIRAADVQHAMRVEKPLAGIVYGM